ncbi:hypothetical protein A2Z00_02910 [Candidatus Gottesmanbacteria bacterium RBG_13_45_10]|uniref:beta-glucosidase n=1 Tax=Candidatus Gottesmanbacteria bacterium RBG_13_45_10 TaxID=1798370 RepID=A0A1F5ZH78_9BACT|nr:MAG: hypothetical protein A2Z00_02910 [Candidatus Gottesmanbacteria bacterium RBG_13_45_10]
MTAIGFPDTFCFGVADADLQVIGEKYTCAEEKSVRTMWSYFAQHSGKCFQHQGPEEGIDRYHKWQDDIRLMSSLGVKHYRTSVSMSRILKENGEVNRNAVTWYTNYFKTLKKNGIAIYATLYHWELPLYLHEIGGWKNPRVIDVFVKHARAVAENLGEYIDEYFILNEPWCASMLSYHLGAHAPGETNLKGALTAAHHLLLAQGAAYEALLHLNNDLKISTVVNVEPSYAFSLRENDREAARRADGYFNRWFLDPVYLGSYPEDMVALYGKDMPKVKAADMKTIAIGINLYTLGINNYCGRINRYDPKAPLGYSSVNKPGAPTNDLGWPIFVPPYYPEALYDILQQVYYSYQSHGLKRLYITENGMALESKVSLRNPVPSLVGGTGTGVMGDEKVVNDQRRVEYLKAHITQVYKAVQRGIPIEGYFAWTLMDNFEWAEGYRPKSAFGMVYVDRTTMERIPKQSALWYANLMKTNTISTFKGVTLQE